MSETLEQTRQLAEFIAQLKFEDIPQDVLTLGRLSILDALGCGLAGAISENAQILNSYLSSYCMPEGARVIGTDLRLPSPFAALANGNAIHADDYDDTLRSNPASGYHGSTHPTGPVLAALLPLVDRQDCTGEGFVTAYHCGVEAMAKINDAIGERHFHSGFHPTATMSVFGAAAAACRFLELSPTQTVAALGIAGSQAGGLRDNFGSMVKPFHPGRGAMDGLMAAEMAAAGFTASNDILGAERGFFNAYGDGFDPQPITTHLGNPWSFSDPGMWLKPYPSGMRTHPAMSCLSGLLDRYGIVSRDIEGLEVTTNAGVYNTLLHHNPTLGLQGKFSMEFCLAKIILDGTMGLDDFSDEAVNRPDVRDVMQRIHYQVYSDEEARAGAYTTVTTILTFNLADGRLITERIDYGKGSREDPMDDQDVANKVQDCARYRGWPDVKTQALIDLVRQLDTLPSLLPLCQSLSLAS